jgi:predicted flap endonuclease-1-like 5' DNA nuclease
MSQVKDEDMILILYTNPNRGQHRVVGPATQIDYRYRAGGGTERFYVHRADIAARPDFFTPVPTRTETAVVEMQKPAPLPPPPPKPLMERHAEMSRTEKADLQSIPGITNEVEAGLIGLGVETWEDVIKLTVDELLGIKGVGEKRAQTILSYARKVASHD